MWFSGGVCVCVCFGCFCTCMHACMCGLHINWVYVYFLLFKFNVASLTVHFWFHLHLIDSAIWIRVEYRVCVQWPVHTKCTMHVHTASIWIKYAFYTPLNANQEIRIKIQITEPTEGVNCFFSFSRPILLPSPAPAPHSFAATPPPSAYTGLLF